MSTLKNLLITAAINMAAPVHAQMGLRFSPLNHENVEKGANTGFTVGADADISDRTAMAFDYGFGFDLWGSADANSESFSYSGFEVVVSPVTRTRCFTLRSQYFLTDMAGGPFIATSFGLRTVILELSPSVWDPNSSFGSPLPTWARASESRTMLTQLGLRLGTRSELNGFHGELYVGFGVNLGELDGMLPVYMTNSDRALSRTYFPGWLLDGYRLVRSERNEAPSTFRWWGFATCGSLPSAVRTLYHR